MSTLLEEIKRASIEARKAKDTVAANLLGLVLADIQNRAIAAKREPTSDDAEAALKRAKKMNDQAVALAPSEQLAAERAVLDSFMVHALAGPSDEEINELIAKLLADNPEKVNPKAAGFFMGQIMKATSGKANPNAIKPLLEKALAE